MAERDEIAWKLAEGIAGYFQYVNASQLLAVPGEDSAQFVMCQILQSLQRYRVQVSTAPTDTLPDGKPVRKGGRIDAGLLAKADDASTWYGAVEVKWSCAGLIRLGLALLLVRGHIKRNRALQAWHVGKPRHDLLVEAHPPLRRH